MSVDGGGIRGYSSLLILDALMKRVAHWEKELYNRDVDPNQLLPCHYFDYLWGTSTGGFVQKRPAIPHTSPLTLTPLA